MIKIKLLIIHTLLEEFVIDENHEETYEIVTATRPTPESIIEQLTAIKPQAIILNCGNAAFREIFFCSKIRRNFNGPIIIVTSNNDSDFETAMLECGADDFITIPVSKEILMNRLKTLFRRYCIFSAEELNDNNNHSLKIGNMLINKAIRSVYIDNQEIALTAAEFDLLWMLATYKNRIVSRDSLYRVLLKAEYDGLDRCIDNRISRLRRKLQDNSKNPHFIKSIRSEGYLLVED